MKQLSESPNDRTTTQQPALKFRFPPAGSLDQDQEWCEFEHNGQWRRVRFHDYHEVFAVPGLYEAIFARKLKCSSPQRVVGLLDDVLSDFPQNPEDLRVLDVGAGNGMVGQELRNLGVKRIVGIDIIAEAREAALRDRPGVYEDYHVADLTQLDDQHNAEIAALAPNCMCCVAALGYGDIPTAAFANAVNFVEQNGWLVFNIKEKFLHLDDDDSGFSKLIGELQRRKVIQVQAYRRYCHRLSIQGKPLYYVAIVANKLGDIPQELVEACG